MLIGINGRIGHGKDAVADYFAQLDTEIEIKKFATDIKLLCSRLINCKVEDFESQEFKKSILPSEWDYFTVEGDDTIYNHYDIKNIKNKNITHHQMTVRDLLQKVGTEAGRYGVHPDIWVNGTLSSYMFEDKWVISDLRFKNEARGIKAKGGILIKVVRDAIPIPDNEHQSEKDLDDWNEWDYVIRNNHSLESLNKSVINIYNEINAKEKSK